MDVVRAALVEDLGMAGDISAEPLFKTRQRAVFRLLSKDSGVLCGLEVFASVFREMDASIKMDASFSDGVFLKPGDIVARVEGPVAAILSAERTALNFLSHLSAVATKTAFYVSELEKKAADSGVKPPVILDTRKTVPGLRRLQKYAVRTGGGQNHRMGLFDMVMLKDNHIDAAGGINKAMEIIKKSYGQKYKIEVETRNLREVEEAIAAGADRIMLDNMSDELMRDAVKLIAGRTETEASGNMSLERLLNLHDSGIDFVSFGELTNSVKVFDFSLKQERNL